MGVLDADITKNLIRLGSRYATDERVAEFSLENAERLCAKSNIDREVNIAYRQMKETEIEMAKLMTKLALRDLPPEHIENCLPVDYPLHYEELVAAPPAWVWSLFMQFEESQVDCETVGESCEDTSILKFWLAGRDINFLQPPQPQPTLRQNRAPKPAARRNQHNTLSRDNTEEPDSEGEFYTTLIS